MDQYGGDGHVVGTLLQESAQGSWQISGRCLKCHCFLGSFVLLLSFSLLFCVVVIVQFKTFQQTWHVSLHVVCTDCCEYVCSQPWSTR